MKKEFEQITTAIEMLDRVLNKRIKQFEELDLPKKAGDQFAKFCDHLEGAQKVLEKRANMAKNVAKGLQGNVNQKRHDLEANFYAQMSRAKTALHTFESTLKTSGKGLWNKAKGILKALKAVLDKAVNTVNNVFNLTKGTALRFSEAVGKEVKNVMSSVPTFKRQ